MNIRELHNIRKTDFIALLDEAPFHIFYEEKNGSAVSFKKRIGRVVTTSRKPVKAAMTFSEFKRTNSRILSSLVVDGCILIRFDRDLCAYFVK